MTALSHFKQPLLGTPFDARTAPLNRLHSWAAWSGFRAAQCFGAAEMEHSAIRNAATLYDISPMMKYRIIGPEAAAFLNRLTVRNAGRLATGAVQYTAWTDDAGKIMDDGTLFRLGERDFRLCCQERHLPWLIDSAFGFDVTVTDESEAVAALALQGPTSAAVLREAGFAIDMLKPFRTAEFPFGDDGVMISRTGFTGDLGYELWVAPADALALWDLLMERGALHGITPVGGEAVMLARTEAGFLTTNLDFIPAQQALREDRVRSPLELGLGWMIDWEKGHFTGRRALLAEYEGRTSKWALVGLDIPGNISAEGALLYYGGKHEVGFVTAACWSPTLKRNIAIAHVSAGHADCRDLWVEIYALRELQYHKRLLPVMPAARPFFSPERRRLTPPARF